MGMQTVCFDVANLGRKCCEIEYHLNKIEAVGKCWNESPVSSINPNTLLLGTLATCGVIVAFALVQRYFFSTYSLSRLPLAASYNNVDALIIAAKEGNKYLITKCLEAGVDINEVGEDGKTALTTACKAGKWAAAKLLIEKGASVNQGDHLSRTALHFAAAADNVEMVRFLFQHQADPNAQDTDGQTPFYSACKATNAKKELLELLYVNTKVLPDNEGNTPLHLACKGNKTAVQFLVTKVDVDVDAKNNSEATPCHIAAKTNRSDILDVLLSSKANPNLQDDEGNTSLHISILEACDEAMATLLHFHKINPNILNKRGESPFHLSIYKLHGDGDDLALKLLECKNIDINQPIHQQNTVLDEEKILQGMTPVHLAVHFGHKEILESLCKKGAKLDLCDGQGNTPLLFSILNDKTAETEILIKNMSEKALQSPTKDGFSYAEHAATRFDERTLKLLAQKRIIFTYSVRNESLILLTMKNFQRFFDTMFKKYPMAEIEQLKTCMEEIDKATTCKSLSPVLVEFSEEIDLKLKYFAKFSEEASRGNRYFIIKDLSVLLQCFQFAQIEYVKPLYLRSLALRIPEIPARILDTIKQTKFSSADELLSLLFKLASFGLAHREEEQDLLQNVRHQHREIPPLHLNRRPYRQETHPPKWVDKTK